MLGLRLATGLVLAPAVRLGLHQREGTEVVGHVTTQEGTWEVRKPSWHTEQGQ